MEEKLKGYKIGEIAHIENIMKSEFKSRKHTRRQETELISTIETEQEIESQKDLQSTERFEMQKEVSKEQSQEMSVEAGVNVTASYGPVKVEAHSDFVLAQTSSLAKKSSTKYAREVTKRSLSKIREQVREQKTKRTFESFTEENKHGFDNTEGSTHVTGIYRWVDKEYTAYVINYGRRMMIEGIIPEPAAFYRYVTKERSKPAFYGIDKPKLPTVNPNSSSEEPRLLHPSHLSKENYMDFIQAYNVDLEDIEPYPPSFLLIGDALAAAPGAEAAKNKVFAQTSEKLVIPKGYMGVGIYGETSRKQFIDIKDDDTGVLKVNIGGRVFYATDTNLDLTDEVTTDFPNGIAQFRGIDEGRGVPFSVTGFGARYQVNVVVKCQLTEEAIIKWQLKTYNAIMTGYRTALNRYNEKVSAVKISSGVEIEGRNPLLNRKIEQDELKKGMLRLITRGFRHGLGKTFAGLITIPEYFNAMKDNYPPVGYPDFSIKEALKEGKIIQFFEQAFEWNNMTYRFYPYHWGRQKNWDNNLILNDPDPKFVDFLKAGAARVIIPTRTAYAIAVLNYLATGEINDNQDLKIGHSLFVSIINELQEDAGLDEDELGNIKECDKIESFDESFDNGGSIPCLKDTWRYRLPTTLVHLQKSSDLNPVTVSNTSPTAAIPSTST